MGKIEIDHTGSGGGITLSSDGTDLLLDGTAIGGGGGASALTIEDKTTAYTVIADDLGKVINCTTGTFTVTLTAAATLGAGFNVTIWNIGTGVITIDPDGTERINELLTLTLQKGEGVSIICTGTEFQTGISKLRLYSDNTDVNANSPIAAGDRSVAIGAGATTANFATMAIGYLSLANQNGAVALGYTSNATGAYSLAISGNAGRQYTTAIGVNSGGSKAVTATGDGAMALGGSYASGTDSFAAAITNNTSTYGATGANAVAMGYRSKASGSYGFAVGYQNIASGTYSVALGRNTTSAGAQGFAAGYLSEAAAVNSTAFGFRSKTRVEGQLAVTSGYFGAAGDAQSSIYTFRSDTADATAEALTTDNSTASTDNQIILPNNSAYGFTGIIVAREAAASTDDFAVWEIKGGAVRGATAATTALGTYNINKISESAGAANWSIALSADTTNGAVAITVTGEAAHNIRWVATINTSEVTY